MLGTYGREYPYMKDCINPKAYWQCISLTKGKCLHKGPCEPIDQDGNRYSMIAFQEDGKTICYIRDISFHHMLKHPELLPEKKIAPIYDAEAEQRKAHNAATRGRIIQRPKIMDEPSPHPFMDPIIARAKFQNEAIEKIIVENVRSQRNPERPSNAVSSGRRWYDPLNETHPQRCYIITEEKLAYLENVFYSQFEKIGSNKWKSPSNATNCFEATGIFIRSHPVPSEQEIREKVMKDAIQLQKDVENAFSQKTGEYNPTSIMLVQRYVTELRSKQGEQE